MIEAAGVNARRPICASNVSFHQLRTCVADAYRRYVPILLQKSLMVSTINDSLALTRFVAEAGDDGAAQS